MRLVTFERNGQRSLGAWTDADRRILDLTQMAALARTDQAAAFSGMMALIEAGEGALDLARGWIERPREDAMVETRDVVVLAPLPLPAQIRDFLCFEEHLLKSSAAAITILSGRDADPEAKRRELEASGQWKIPAVWYKKPIYYTASRFAVSGPGEDIHWPAFSNFIDYELEFAAVIGKAGRDIAREDARAHIFGYTIFNDWSARDEQSVVMEGRLGPGKGKDFDQSNTLGPCLVTADEIGDPYALTMTARIDGEEWSRGSSGAMYHRFEDCIADVSRGQTVHPGEVFCSGTVGTGSGVENLRFLKGGETVELEVEGIGVLRNRLVR